MSNDTIREVRQRAEDAAHTAVGVGVLGFQQAQVRRRAAQARLADAARDAKVQATTLKGEARTAVGSLGADVKGRVEPVVARLGQRVDPLVADLRSRLEPAVETLETRVRRVVGGSTPSDEQPGSKPSDA